MAKAAARAAAISFDCSRDDERLITEIVDRYAAWASAQGEPISADDWFSARMDITATHANGNPLRLADLLAADDFNFLHDVFGIQRHLSRTTGKLMHLFSPRFSQRV